MAGEIKTRGGATGAVVYATLLGSGGCLWNTSGAGAFEAYSAGSWPSYAISLTENGASATYVGSVPAAVPPGAYDVDARRQVGATPSPADPNVGTGEVQWDGTKEVPLASLATSGQLGQYFPLQLAKGVAVSGFLVYFKSAADHVTPLTSGVCSGQINRAGAWFPLQSGNFTERGNGFYSVNLTSGDVNAGTLAMLFTANGVSGGAADPVPLSFVLQRTSGG